jgi:hypothetical protein
MKRRRMSVRSRSVGTVALAVALVCLGSACASPAATTTELDLRAEVFQYRLDYAPRILQVKLVNNGAAPVEVSSVALESPRFTDDAAIDRGPTVRPGSAVDVKLQLPAPRCDVGDEPDVVVVVAAVGEEPEQTVRIEPEDEQHTLDRINAEDCLADSVDRVARISMPTTVRREGSGTSVRGWFDVAITPVTDAGDPPLDFTIDRIMNTTLLDAVHEAGYWPVETTIAQGEPPSILSLPVRPARCDPHAIAEDKRGTILPFEVRTGDGRSGQYDVVSSDELKADIYAFVAEYCGF